LTKRVISKNKEYFERKTKEENKLSVGPNVRKERADSKASSGQLIRKSKGQGHKAAPRSTHHVGSTQKSKVKGKAGRSTGAKRTTGSSQYKGGPGYR